MTPLLAASLLGVFMTVALVSGAVAYLVLQWQAPGRRRLQEVSTGSRSEVVTASAGGLSNRPHRTLERIATFVPKSPKEMNRLQRRLVRAGYHSLTPAVVFAGAELLLPVLFGLPVLLVMGWPQGAIYGAAGAMIGFLLPGTLLRRLINRRGKAITNGLPDVLDLLIVCLEAGCSLDQAIVKATEELSPTYPALAEELKMITTETRAGKPRIEAFKNFEARTRIDDVRALVAMLVQTDRFGTSISQALRTFAEVSRTKRRQRAEEKAAKVGVKLVFPLVLFLFPALYVVILGPSVIKILKFFTEQ